MTGHWWREILEVVKEDGVFCTNAGFLKEQGSLPLAGWMEWGKGCWTVRKQWLFFFLATSYDLQSVLQTGIEPMSSSVKTQSPNHWTTREFPMMIFFYLNAESLTTSTTSTTYKTMVLGVKTGKRWCIWERERVLEGSPQLLA